MLVTLQRREGDIWGVGKTVRMGSNTGACNNAWVENYSLGMLLPLQLWEASVWGVDNPAEMERGCSSC